MAWDPTLRAHQEWLGYIRFVCPATSGQWVALPAASAIQRFARRDVRTEAK